MNSDRLPLYLLSFAVAMGAGLVLTPLVRRLALATNTVDHPNARKVHQTVTPLLGGLAIYGAIFITLLLGGLAYVVLQALDINLFSRQTETNATYLLPQFLSIMGAITVAAGFGVWDDKYGLRPLAKIIGQLISATLLVVAGVTWTFNHAWLDIPATYVWVVVISNAFNLLDNMDGASSGIAAMAAAFMFLLALITRQFLVAGLGAAVAGACLAFLYYNFNPFKTAMRIFMGDAGSLSLGVLMAALSMKLHFKPMVLETWMLPLVIMGLPVFDTTLVILSRLRRRIHIFTAGKDHTSHRLVRLGLTPREAVLVLYLVAGFLGFSSLVLYFSTTRIDAYLIVLLLAACAVTGWSILLRIENREHLFIEGQGESPSGATLQPPPPGPGGPALAEPQPGMPLATSGNDDETLPLPETGDGWAPADVATRQRP